MRNIQPNRTTVISKNSNGHIIGKFTGVIYKNDGKFFSMISEDGTITSFPTDKENFNKWYEFQ